MKEKLSDNKLRYLECKLPIILSLRQRNYPIAKIAEIVGVSAEALLSYAKESKWLNIALKFTNECFMAIINRVLIKQAELGNIEAVKLCKKYKISKENTPEVKQDFYDLLDYLRKVLI